MALRPTWQHGSVTRDERRLKGAVIGAGMAGILSAVRLPEAGIEDFTIYEKADGIGGTWRENTYPGLSCDVPSQLYSFSFAPSPDWSRHFSPGPGDPGLSGTSSNRPWCHGSRPAGRRGDLVRLRGRAMEHRDSFGIP